MNKVKAECIHELGTTHLHDNFYLQHAAESFHCDKELYTLTYPKYTYIDDTHTPIFLKKKI